MFVTAVDASYEKIENPIVEQTIEDLIEEIRTQLKARGAYGIRGCARMFRNLDDNRNRQIDLKEFMDGLLDYKITLTEDQAKQILKKFDRDGNGTVNFDELLVAIRGTLNEFRRGLIKKAYAKLDVNNDGKVTLEDIAQIYDPTKHPDVQSGNKKPHQIYQEFMSQWDTQVADGIVTLDEFNEYFRDVSASID